MLFASLSVAGVFADGAAPDKPKEWPYGPYDKLHRDPPHTPKNEPQIFRFPPAERARILIYRGIQQEVVQPTTSTNTIAAPRLDPPK